MAEQKNTGPVSAQHDVVLGNQTNITYVMHMPAFQPPPDLEQLRADYLAHLRRTHHALDFRGIMQLQSISRDLLLEEIYVPLLARSEQPAGETWERRLAGRKLQGGEIPDELLALAGKGEADPPTRVEEALGKHPRVVVIGDPGSGKSTLLKYLALRLANESDAALPILLPLNAYAEALGEDKDLNLQAYLPRYFAGLAQGLAGLQPLFDTALGNGQAVVLLDGLDEVQIHRAHLIHKVEGFVSEVAAKGCKVIVTSRIVGYKDAPLNSRDWRLYTLLDFDRQAIEDFAAKWCPAFEKCTLGDTPEAARRAEEERCALLDSLDANPGVAQLAANPLLLTILALIKRQGVSLPNHRIELYELYLKTLIETWSQARSLDKRPVGPLLNTRETIGVLGPLALRIRQDNPTHGLISEDRLLDWLTEHFQGDEWGLKRGEAGQRAHDFLQSVRRYSNLLVERGHQRYGFLHLTFEEALAARGLEKLAQADFSQSLRLILDHLTDPAWRETILLTVGVWGLIRENEAAAGKAVQAMLEATCPKDCAGQPVLLAGACLEDVGVSGLGRAATQSVLEALQKTACDRALPPPVQRDAGFILGRLAGSSEAFLRHIRPDLDELVMIPAGPFLYGDEKQKKTIERPFQIGKYPVTNLQYRRFVEAGGYDRQEYWSADGWLWRTGKWDTKAPDRLKDWLKNRPPEKRGEPFYWHDRKWNNPLAPVVGVSWFEAAAYCNWLTATRGDGRSYRLPSEKQWERSARGKEGREYAWGNGFDRDKLNSAGFWNQDDGESFVNNLDVPSTTIVGQFMQGNTPDGIGDLSGNVWEWAASWYEAEQINRVLRGGAFNLRSRHVRAACRDWIVADDFSNDTGFRVSSPG